MKNRTSLMLMEQLIMVLVFALAAAICLDIFIKADEISRHVARRDEAVLIAQNAAEVLKATSGDTDRTMKLVMPGVRDFTVEIEKIESAQPLMGKAEIQVYLEDEMLFVLQTGWQEGNP